MAELSAPPANPVPWLCWFCGLLFPVPGVYQCARDAEDAASRWLCEVAGVIADPRSPDLVVMAVEAGRVYVHTGEDVVGVELGEAA